jgi:hypothetical protein
LLDAEGDAAGLIADTESRYAALAARMTECDEQCLFQQLALQPAIEALDVAALHGPARPDEMPIDVEFLCRGEGRV